MAVGFWNFTGAGIFGFLINMPIVSYFEMGTNLTPNHGHAAMMGVFGMLGVALDGVRPARDDVATRPGLGLERYVRCGFWGLNIGLAMMVVFSLFPSGVLQVHDVIAERLLARAQPRLYRRARCRGCSNGCGMPGDLVFIFLGALPIAIALCLGYLGLWASARRPPRHGRFRRNSETDIPFGRRRCHSAATADPIGSQVSATARARGGPAKTIAARLPAAVRDREGPRPSAVATLHHVARRLAF